MEYPCTPGDMVTCSQDLCYQRMPRASTSCIIGPQIIAAHLETYEFKRQTSSMSVRQHYYVICIYDQIASPFGKPQKTWQHTNTFLGLRIPKHAQDSSKEHAKITTNRRALPIPCATNFTPMDQYCYGLFRLTKWRRLSYDVPIGIGRG